MSKLNKRPNADTYISAGDMSGASITGDWIPVGKNDELHLFFENEATGAPAGNIFVDVRKDSTFNSLPLNLDSVHGTGITHTAGTSNPALSGAVRGFIAIAAISGEFRLRYVRSAGGTANTTFKAAYRLKEYN